MQIQITINVTDELLAEIMEDNDVTRDEAINGLQDFAKEVETTPALILENLDYFNQ